MQRSNELNTFGMTNTIYCGLLCHANGGGGGNLSSKEWDAAASHLHTKPSDQGLNRDFSGQKFALSNPISVASNRNLSSVPILEHDRD